MDVRTRLKNGFLLWDGAMGTMLQKSGVELGRYPETLAITNPQAIYQIQKQYVDAGCDVLLADTFGCNPYKLEGSGYEVEQVAAAAIAIAKRAAEGRAIVALDTSIIGELLEPAGTLKFEQAVEIYARLMRAGAAGGVDMICIETMTDLGETKAALLAAKETCDLPVLCSMTFEENGRTFTGVDIPSMALTLEGLGADAIGINCSLGPVEIEPLVRQLLEWTRLPVVIMPNAGLPVMEGDTLRYSITQEEFVAQMAKYADLGVAGFGGCCGTTPEYIAGLRRMLDQKKRVVLSPPRRSALCSGSHTEVIDGAKIIGERINPTGKKLFKQAVLEGNYDYILAQGVAQAQAGAEILDVNLGVPGIDEAAAMVRAVKSLQGILSQPLVIDSSDPAAIEAALRVYNGKPLVNSVNGEEAVLRRILPLVKKYGAAVIGLTLDEKGIPATAEERLAIARRILARAQEYGIPKEDVYIDCLTLTVSAEQEKAPETLRAIRLVKEKLGLKTVLGVSNISFGLPQRELVNTAFLPMALQAGLDLAILNPNVPAMTGAVDAFRVITGADQGAAAYIARHAGAQSAPAAAPSGVQEISAAISAGLREDCRRLTRELLAGEDALSIINGRLIPALDQVGSRYEKGEIFLPQLIQSAEAAKEAFQVIKEQIASQPGQSGVTKGKILIATVKGDIHDIGKNIVKVILENYGYQIIDLGKDVPVETVVQAARDEQVRLVGLSALMTTTVKNMAATIQALRQAGLGCKVFVGGAVLTPEFAREIGADFYARDAKESVDIARRVLDEGE